jgi:hypothetical protein
MLEVKNETGETRACFSSVARVRLETTHTNWEASLCETLSFQSVKEHKAETDAHNSRSVQEYNCRSAAVDCVKATEILHTDQKASLYKTPGLQSVNVAEVFVTGHRSKSESVQYLKL